MNWYFEEQGVSRGPFTEERMIAKFKEGELTSDVLIWQPEMKEWRGVREVNPEWLPEKQVPASSKETSPPSVVENKPAPAETTRAVKRVAPTAAKEAASAIPTVEPTPEEVTPPQNQKTAPPQSKLKPKAPVEDIAPDAPKSGLFKRVFGLSGKKK
jgi:hypothetical protein